MLIAGEITGIPPGYGEGSEVRVTFEMGFDGVLHVTAFHVDAACRSCSPPPPAPRSRRPRWPASATSWGSSAVVNGSG